MIQNLLNFYDSILNLYFAIPMPWRVVSVIFMLFWLVGGWILPKLLLPLITSLLAFVLKLEYYSTSGRRNQGKKPRSIILFCSNIVDGPIRWLDKIQHTEYTKKPAFKKTIFILVTTLVLLWYVRPILSGTNIAEPIDKGFLLWQKTELMLPLSSSMDELPLVSPPSEFADVGSVRTRQFASEIIGMFSGIVEIARSQISKSVSEPNLIQNLPVELKGNSTNFVLTIEHAKIENNVLRLSGVVTRENSSQPIQWYDYSNDTRSIFIRTDQNSHVYATRIGDEFGTEFMIEPEQTYKGWIEFTIPLPCSSSFWLFYPNTVEEQLILPAEIIDCTE